MTPLTDYQAWLKHGVDMGWVGPAVCVNIYESPEHRKEIENNHSPSLWRR